MAWLMSAEGLWHLLRRPWLLILSSLLVCLLLLSAVGLPQLPGQLSGDATASARWLVGASADYGWAGELLRSLGLFNVLHSVLLQVALALITLVLVVYLGELAAVVLRYRHLTTLLAQPIAAAGEPLPAPTARHLYRWRGTLSAPVATIAEQLQPQLAKQQFNEVKSSAFSLPADEPAEQPAPENVNEVRYVATRHLRWAVVRLLLMVGLLLAIGVVWGIVIRGWEVSVPILAPGEQYRSAAHALALEYQIPTRGAAGEPALQLAVGEATGVLAPAADQAGRIAGVDVRVADTLPGLYIATADGQPALARAGQSETVGGLGLIFPSPGSEESILLPQAALGLRIVRLGDELAEASGASFLLEVNRVGSTQPPTRLEIGHQLSEVITLDEADFTLHFHLLPGLVVEARYLPGVWLLWVALLLVIIGGVGFWFRPAFLVAQIAPWPPDRSVVVLQSDEAVTLRALQDDLTSANAGDPA
jgi:hypothetical protein